MNSNAKTAAEYYALGAISAEQVMEFCSSNEEYEECMKYAERYSKEYRDYLDGLEKAAEYHLQDEYNYCIFTLKMSPGETLEEWDL